MLLDTLPNELLSNVFENLSAKPLWRDLRPVNAKLNCALMRPRYWLRRANERYGLVLPSRLTAACNDNDQSVQNAQIGQVSTSSSRNDDEYNRSRLMPIFRCIATEEAANRWGTTGGLEHWVDESECHLGTIDALRLFQSPKSEAVFCLSGARDREIKLWRMGSEEQQNSLKPEIQCTVAHAHDGWIWSISPTETGSHFYSASWDSMVKRWQMAEAGIVPLLRLAMLEAALCCVAEGDHLLYVSTFRRGPLLFDTRVGPKAQAELNFHGQKAVIELATGPDCNQLFSIGEDCQLASVDKRQFHRLLHSHRTDTIISHVDYAEGQLCLGLRNGNLLFFDPDTLELENKLTIREDGLLLRGHQIVRVTRGATFCAFSSDGHLRVFSPGLRPRLLAGVQLADGSVTRLDMYRGHLIAAMGMGSLRYWPPPTGGC